MKSLAFTLVICALPAWAQAGLPAGSPAREVSGTVPLDAATSVRVASEWGEVHLLPAAGPRLRYKLRLRTAAGPAAAARLAQWPVEFVRQGDELILRAELPDGAAPADLEIELDLPATIRSVTVTTAVGGIFAQHLAAALVLTTNAGDVHADEVTGDLQARSGTGDLIIGHAAGVVADTAGAIQVDRGDGPLTLTDRSGPVTLHQALGMVRIQSSGGNIDIGSAAARLVASSGGGNIHVGSASGVTELNTGGGNIVVDAAAEGLDCTTGKGDLQLQQLHGSVQARTGAGAIAAAFAPGAHLASSLLVSQSGAVAVTLPAALPVSLDAVIHTPDGHRLLSDFPVLLSAMRVQGGELQSQVRLNGGGPTLQLVSTGSDITVHRQ